VEKRPQRGRAEWWLLAGVVVFLSLVIVLWRVGGREPPAGAPQGPAPDFDLPTLAGGQVRLSALKGRVVLVHFWATWCAPCVEEAPLLSRLAERLRGRPFDLIAVSVDDPPTPVRAFFGAQPPAYTVVLNPGGSIARVYGTFKYPESFLVGTQGEILTRFVGAQGWNSPQILAQIEAAMASAPPSSP
jgi:thiol-disulfide isomerase/thioredoxin